MKLIIDIPETLYEVTKDMIRNDMGTSTINKAIANGIPYEPKTGHWIAIENEEMDTIGYFCSICDLPMETEEKTKYCPNCGAKMVEPQKERDKE